MAIAAAIAGSDPNHGQQTKSLAFLTASFLLTCGVQVIRSVKKVCAGVIT